MSQGGGKKQEWKTKVNQEHDQGGLTLDEFKDMASSQLYGMSLSEAKRQGICLDCKEPALPKCYSELGRKEFGISGLCEQCFDKLFQDA